MLSGRARWLEGGDTGSRLAWDVGLEGAEDLGRGMGRKGAEARRSCAVLCCMYIHPIFRCPRSFFGSVDT